MEKFFLMIIGVCVSDCYANDYVIVEAKSINSKTVYYVDGIQTTLANMPDTLRKKQKDKPSTGNSKLDSAVIFNVKTTCYDLRDFQGLIDKLDICNPYYFLYSGGRGTLLEISFRSHKLTKDNLDDSMKQRTQQLESAQ